MRVKGASALLLVLFSIHCSGDITTSDIPSAEQLVSKANNVTLRLLNTLASQKPGSNVLLGPGSLYGLLAMTLLGSVGSTYDELVDLLGFSDDILANRLCHERLGSTLSNLGGVATAVAFDTKLNLRPIYKEFVNRVYAAEAMGLNFNDDLASKEILNTWVAKHTGGLIPEFLKQPLTRDTRLALLSAMQYQGAWKQPFKAEFTRKMPFKGYNGTVFADLMLNIGMFEHEYFIDDGYHMLALPYKNSATMYVIKPLNKKKTIAEVLPKLDWSNIEDHIQLLRKTNTVIRFPRMDLTSNVDLRSVLGSLGVKSMFSPSTANFALMIDADLKETETEQLLSRLGTAGGEDELKREGEAGQRKIRERLAALPNPGVHVDALLHEVKIIVNERGTDAASASAGTIAKSANLFYADRPFAFFIRDHTGLVTFAAIVNNPNAQ